MTSGGGRQSHFPRSPFRPRTANTGHLQHCPSSTCAPPPRHLQGDAPPRGVSPRPSGHTQSPPRDLKQIDLSAQPAGKEIAHMAKTERSHTPPQGLKASGLRLWKSTVEDYELEEHELGMLREACRTADSIDGLQAAVDRDGVLNQSPQGLRAHPALVELRQQRICFARLVAQLGLPTGDESASGQRRSARGVYGITGAVS